MSFYMTSDGKLSVRSCVKYNTLTTHAVLCPWRQNKWSFLWRLTVWWWSLMEQLETSGLQPDFCDTTQLAARPADRPAELKSLEGRERNHLKNIHSTACTGSRRALQTPTTTNRMLSASYIQADHLSGFPLERVFCISIQALIKKLLYSQSPHKLAGTTQVFLPLGWKTAFGNQMSVLLLGSGLSSEFFCPYWVTVNTWCCHQH